MAVKLEEEKELNKFVSGSKKVGFFQTFRLAFRAMFESNDDKAETSKEVLQQVDELNLKSDKAIKALENRLTSNGGKKSSGTKQTRKDLQDSLKVESKDYTVNQAEDSKTTKNKDEKELGR